MIHRSVDERIGRGAVLLVVFQIGMDGHRLCLPRLLGGAGADIAANGAKLRVGDAHQTVHKVQRNIALQAFSLDVEVRHGDGITGAKEPCKAVFLLGRDQGRVRAAHSSGCRSRRGQHANAQRCCQHKRRRAAHKPMQMFQK